MDRIGAVPLVGSFLDPGSWRSWDEPVLDPPGASTEYSAELAAARARTGLDESVITGEGLLDGRRVAVAAGEFGFLGGSFGVAAATRLEQAVRRATAERLPFLAAPASGGTRMQEGTVAFVQMVRITEAIREHRAAGLPYLVYLRDPTTGGVLASWGSLGQVTVAEPGALIGFLGPRVYRALHGEDFPAGVQVAENLYEHGLVDAVLPLAGLREITARALRVLCDRDLPAPPPEPSVPPVPAPVDAWDAVMRSRRSDRPGVRDLLRDAATDVVVLRGTGEGERDEGLLLALARFGAAPCVVLGQDRKAQGRSGPMGPGALRAARRGMRLAEELGLPLVTVIDTQGAALSREAEEGGLAGEIARSLHDMLGLRTSTVAVILGSGSGGAALALLPADHVLCAQHGWLSPLPPEGASAILHGTAEHAADMARLQGISSTDLLGVGIVDEVVVEHPDAADEPAAFVRRLADRLEEVLVAQSNLPAQERASRRTERLAGRGQEHGDDG